MLILNIQRMSTEDGPGLRTTLFVKGCPLKCKWCHNPESISAKKQIEWLNARCIGCGICINECLNGALIRDNGAITIDNNKCNLCLKCVDNCPGLALLLKGEEVSVYDLYKELIKDKAYFGKEGGVTLSGGEILSQSEEAKELLRMLKGENIHTAVDTSGFCRREDIDNVFPYTDMFLYDIKLIDEREHLRYTMHSNDRIIDNYYYLLDKIKGTNKEIWIRTPIIPGATDTEDNIIKIAALIKGKVNRWELVCFNNLCRDKYIRLDEEWEFSDSELITDKKLKKLLSLAKEQGINNVYGTGMTRL